MTHLPRAACIDREPADRQALQHRLDAICREHRSVTGHIGSLHAYGAALDEVFLNAAPDVFVVGPRFAPDEAYAVCSELNGSFPAVPIILFLDERHFRLRTLQHFDSFCCRVFPEGESSVSVLHSLLQIAARRARGDRGRLISVVGAKGGVGATSIAVGLAHAADSLGLRAVAADLSNGGVLPFYLACPAWESPEYAAALRSSIAPEPELLEQIVMQAPNGVSLVLPPAGGAEMRELWLRCKNRFEFSLSVFDLLAEQYDVVIVDHAGVEGILPYSLLCRADTMLLVSSNEAASVHLLGHVLSEAVEIPGNADIRLLINELRPQGLALPDIIDFLSCYPAFTREMALDEVIGHDAAGKNWIGSGSSFYSESRKATRRSLERLLAQQGGCESAGPAPAVLHRGLFSRFTRPAVRREAVPRALPEPAAPLSHDTQAVRLDSIEACYTPPSACQ